MSAQLRSFVARWLLPAVLSFAASGTANAATIQLRAWLNGAQEVPPVMTSATGLAAVTYDTVTRQLSWNVTPIVGSANINASEAAQLLSGQWYIDLHSENFPFGEIRGQVLVVRGDLDGDGRSDVVWRNVSTGDNYLYPMNGTAILPGEGYLRQVADQNWQIAGIGDFDGDGRADILWRNTSTGENYMYLMNGTSVIGEGLLRTVADQNWHVAGVGDFDGDGRADIFWRNSSSGETYIYLMSATSIVGEGYLRTIADQNWRLVGVGDFNGDGRADILWRHSSSGENYIYPMDGLAIKPTEGYLRTVADQNWFVVGVADFDGDGSSDILWRNSSSGENYIYPMAGLTILPTEGYMRTVADQSWRVVRLGDFDGDGRSDILWRNTMTGEGYLYPMDGKSIKSAEGYIRTVADQNWRTQPETPTTSGLDFPSNLPGGQAANALSVRFKFTGSALVPIYGTAGAGVTYLWKYKPRQQAGYYTAFFWANDDGAGNFDTYAWKDGNTVVDSYYGAHPYPNPPPDGTAHLWEIAVEQRDYTDTEPVVKDAWYSQAFRAWGANGAAKNHEFYWNLPNLTTAVVTRTSPSTYGNDMPPFPALTFGDAPWAPCRERANGILRGFQIYDALLSTTQIKALAACDTDACVLSTAATLGIRGSLWYLNMNPRDASDISDKSGAGHHPAWWNSNRPTHWVQ